MFAYPAVMVDFGRDASRAAGGSEGGMDSSEVGSKAKTKRVKSGPKKLKAGTTSKNFIDLAESEEDGGGPGDVDDIPLQNRVARARRVSTRPHNEVISLSDNDDDVDFEDDYDDDFAS